MLLFSGQPVIQGSPISAGGEVTVDAVRNINVVSVGVTFVYVYGVAGYSNLAARPGYTQRLSVREVRNSLLSTVTRIKDR